MITEKTPKLRQLDSRLVDRLAAGFLRNMADNCERQGSLIAAKRLRRRADRVTPAGLLHKGKKGRR